ncbi:RAB7A-interacting MON1-CCZ1 complex subunit 1 isoform 7-T12 [Hipposideros larvatus]
MNPVARLLRSRSQLCYSLAVWPNVVQQLRTAADWQEFLRYEAWNGCRLRMKPTLKEHRAKRLAEKWRCCYHFLIRSSAALEKLKLLCGEDKECSSPSNLLELYTQAILDMTYFEENKLVDEDFPEDSSEKVKELISFLSEPEILVNENNMHPKHCDLLGDELLECLSWRRGALLYMYCHSLTKRREWLTRKSNLLKEYLVDGISYLLQMLNYRCPIQLNEGVSFQDLDTAKLLSEVPS